MSFFNETKVDFENMSIKIFGDDEENVLEGMWEVDSLTMKHLKTYGDACYKPMKKI